MSFLGESQQYTQPSDFYKAIYAIRGIGSTRGMACAVNVEGQDPAQQRQDNTRGPVCLVTLSGCIGEHKSVNVDRYSRTNMGNYQLKTSNIIKTENFSFLLVNGNGKDCPKSLYVKYLKNEEKMTDLMVYTITASKGLEALTLKYDQNTKKHILIIPPKRFDFSLLGSPIIVNEEYFVGVLKENDEGEPIPCFIAEEEFVDLPHPAENSKPVAGTVYPVQNSEPVSGTVSPGGNLEPVAGIVCPGQNSEPVSGTVSSKQNLEPVSGTVSREQNLEPVSGAVSPVQNLESVPGAVSSSSTMQTSYSVPFAEAPVEQREEAGPGHDINLKGSLGGFFSFNLNITEKGVGALLACVGIKLLANAITAALEQWGLVGPVSIGSLLVELQCNTKESFLSFVEDFKSRKVKQRLEEEFKKVGFEGELEVVITNDEEVLEKLDQIRKHEQGKGKEVEGETPVYVAADLKGEDASTSPASPTEQGTHSEPRRKSYLHYQSKLFVGRDAVVNEIKKKLSSYSARVIIIIAPPGMGKTEVAIRVGHLLQDEDWPVVYVEKQKNLMEICHQIPYQLDHRHWTLNDNIVSHCKRKLSEIEDDTMIILDSTEDAQDQDKDEFDDFVGYLVKYAPKIRTIITTQCDIKSFVSDSIHKIRLDPLDSSSSADLLMQLAPRVSKCYAEEIAELCGRVPLFLVTCACSMIADGFCPEVFTQELRQNPARAVRDSEHLSAVYEDIGRFFVLRLPQQVLRNLVRLSVFPTTFSVKDIQILFNDDCNEDVKTKLIQCCLLKKLNDDDLLAIHPLLKTYCKAEREALNLGDVGRAAEHAFNHHYLEFLRSLHKQFIERNGSSKAILQFRKEKANIMEAFKNCLCDTSEPKEKVFAIDVANEAVDFLAKVISPPKECTILYQKCCDFARNSGDEKRLADSLNSSGFRCLDDAAHCKGNGANLAYQKFLEAYTIRKRLPEEMQKCETHAHVTVKLGLCALLQGDVERGRQLILDGIALREELGVQLYVAAGNCDLGHSYRHCRNHKTALEIWRTKTLPDYLKELGDHPWTATVFHLIASMYLELARENPTQYAGLAEDYTRQALELRHKLLGVHQDTARSHIRLSDVFVIQGKLELALKELEAALEIQKNVLGHVHQDTISTMKKMTDIKDTRKEIEQSPQKIASTSL